jgi:hypothetical protein
MKFDWPRTVLLLLGAVLGIAAGIYKDKISISCPEGPHLPELVATVFAVLAGFLMAIIALILNPPPVRFRSKISQTEYDKLTSNRLMRHNLLFSTYITVLLAVLLSVGLKQTFPLISGILERLYVGLGLAAIVWSYTLPAALARFQRERLDFFCDPPSS